MVNRSKYDSALILVILLYITLTAPALALSANFIVDLNDPNCISPDDNLFCEIQDAIDEADKRTRILVQGYALNSYDAIDITKDNLIIQPRDTVTPIIGGDVSLQANGVTVDGLQVSGLFHVAGSHNSLTNNTATGFRLALAQSNITDNKFTNNMVNTAPTFPQRGFLLIALGGNFTDNEFTNNTVNITKATPTPLTLAIGFSLFASGGHIIDNSFTRNTINIDREDALGFLVLAGFSEDIVKDNEFTNNTVNMTEDNTSGFVLLARNDGSVTDNFLINNTASNGRSGFVLEAVEGGSVTHNTLINNTANGNHFGFVLAAVGTDTNTMHNTLHNNMASNNDTGFILSTNSPIGIDEGSVIDNTLTNNTASGSTGQTGFVDETDDFSANVYINNTCIGEGFIFSIPDGLCE